MFDWLRKALAQPREEWTVATTEENGVPVLLRFRSRIPEGIRVAEYPVRVDILWRFDGAETKGMPPGELNRRMVKLEDLLAQSEGLDVGFLVVSITGNGRRLWTWYVRDLERSLGVLKERLAAEAPPFPVEVTTDRDDVWTRFLGARS